VRIAVDACCWSNRRGFGRFTRELVSHLVREGPQHEFTLVVDASTASLAQFPSRARVEVVHTTEQPTQAASAQGARSPRDLWRMSRAASGLRCDLFFFPAVYSFYPLLRRVPTVVTFHDAIAENHPGLIFPGWRSRLFWNAKCWLAMRQADRVMTVSESARAEIAAAFSYPASRIHVVTEGPGEGFSPLDDPASVREVRDRYRLPEGPLILYVGGISPHKNLQGLLQARARIDRRCHVVIVGDYEDDAFHGCYEELVALRSRLGLEQAVTFTGFVPNADLVALYNAATLLVLPSVDEGFGLPVVEAMACGLPVAASRRGSLPEVLGPAGLFFDPEDSSEMAATIVRLLDDPARREVLRAEGLRRARAFSWEEAARSALRLFDEMAGQSGRVN
jgi:glycosyltransferase involved in cell wall biosynthesis